jgi:ATP-dependent Clp protease ATP-binding subunit ClpX
LDALIEQRLNKKQMGFGADIKTKADTRLGEVLVHVQPEDLLKYGLIPEFVGRLPVVATLEELDEPALIRVLTEPRNALIKQYEKLMSFEKVKLKFTDGAIAAVARKAFSQKTGARGLRAILEEVMLDLMYEIPSQKQIKEVLINEDVIVGKSQPIRIYEQDTKSA